MSVFKMLWEKKICLKFGQLPNSPWVYQVTFSLLGQTQKPVFPHYTAATTC